MMKKRIDELKAPQNILMIGLFLAFLLSHVVHTYFAGMMFTFTEFSKILIMYFLFVLIIDSEKKLKITIYLLIFLTFLLALQGIYQYNTGYGWAGQPIIRHTYEGVESLRITWLSIFNDPNDLGLAFVIGLALLIGLFFGKTNLISKIFILPIAGCIMYALYLTNSRGAYLAFMVMVFFYFVRRSKIKLLGPLIGAGLVFLIFIFGPSRLAYMSTDGDSAYNRVDAWYYGVQLTKANPIFGIGYGMFMDDYGMTAHNTFVLAMTEAGLLGLFFLVGLFYISFKGLSLIQKHNMRMRNYTYGLQGTLIGFTASAFFLSRLYIPIPYILFALSASLVNVNSANLSLPHNVSVNRLTMRDLRNIGLATTGIVAMFYAIVKITL
ncbi:O-antigen ligase family protein [Candidatus Omnitrophota bacterium]